MRQPVSPSTTSRRGAATGSASCWPRTLAERVPAGSASSQVSTALFGAPARAGSAPGRTGMAPYGTRTAIGVARPSTSITGQLRSRVTRRACAAPPAPSTTKAGVSADASLAGREGPVAQPAENTQASRAAVRAMKGE